MFVKYNNANDFVKVKTNVDLKLVAGRTQVSYPRGQNINIYILKIIIFKGANVEERSYDTCFKIHG